MDVRSCPIHHLGFALTGTCRVVMDDGETVDIGPGGAYEIPPGHDAWVIGDEPWVTIESQSGRPLTAMLDAPGERVVASVMFSDIVDSTSRLASLGDSQWRDLSDHPQPRDAGAAPRVPRAGESTTTGDGFLAVFDAATRAVRCGAAMTAAAGQLGIAIRVGIHTGEVEFVGQDARGVAVHAAARVMALAGPGEVLVSSTTNDLLEGSGVTLTDAGTHELKGLTGARRLFRLTAPEPSRPG